jgi:hypothetical protein
MDFDPAMAVPPMGAAEQEAASKHLVAVLSKCEVSQAKDKLTSDERLQLFLAMSGCVRDLAFDAHGCRLVQRTIELTEDSQQVELVNELRGHVVSALDSAHGNHVLQRCIELMRPTAVNFILTELHQSEKSSQLACHRYGCRVLERLIEHFPRDKLVVFLDDVVIEAKALCLNPFGNFVIQHVLEHGSDDQKRRIVKVLKDNLQEIATDAHACSVLDKALSYTTFQQELASAILEKEGLLADMAAQRGGFAATQRLFKVFQGDASAQAKRQLTAHLPELLSTKHGKMLLQSVAPEFTFADEPPSRNRTVPAQSGNRQADQNQNRRRHGRDGRDWRNP